MVNTTSFFEKGKVFDFVENPNNYKTEECDLLIIGGGGILELEDIPKHQLWINKFSPKRRLSGVQAHHIKHLIILFINNLI